MSLELRDYQAAFRVGLRGAYARGARAPLGVLPTGAGKTVLFAVIAHGAAEKGKRTLVLVHRRELLDQTSRTLEMAGVEHGLIAPGVSWRNAAVQVASVQTLVKRLGKLGDPGQPWHPELIVVDEAHHVTPGSSWGQVLGYWGVGTADGSPSGRRALACGWTATPERLDGQGLGVAHGGVFDTLIEGPTTADLVLGGYLARPVVYRAAEVDMDQVPTRGGDYVRGAAAARIDTPQIIGDAVAQYRLRVDGAPALAFCHSVAHAEHVADAFQAAGYQAASIDGKLPPGERRARIRDLAGGALQVLTSCDLVGEGLDVPVVSAAILLRKTLSLALYLQQCGRALRLYPGKTHATILDHVGNSRDERHGLPDLNRAWSLEAEARAKRATDDLELVPKRPLSWTCGACGCAHRPAPRCPRCGWRYPSQAGFEWVDGELVLAESPEDQYARYCSGGLLRRPLEDWLAEAKRRGYKEGWGRHRFEWQEKKIAEQQGRRAA